MMIASIQFLRHLSTAESSIRFTSNTKEPDK